MGKDLDNIDLTVSQRKEIAALLKRYLPDTEVWAYGSRVKFTAKPSSDLDIVAFASKEQSFAVANLKEAFEESSLPFRVDFFIWDEVPEQFHKNIETERVVLQKKEKKDMGPSPLVFSDCANEVRDKVQPEGANGAKYIGLEHIEQGTLHLNGFGSADDVSSTKSKFSKGDILFGKLRPYFRKVVRAPFDGVCSTDIWVVRSTNGIDQGFLYYWMASQEFVDFSMQGSEGTKMPWAKWDHVSRHKVPFFTDDEQRAIAHILGSLDDKIDLNRRMNETLEAMAQALFKSWFVDFDPVIDNALIAGNPIPEELQEKAEARKAKLEEKYGSLQAAASHLSSQTSNFKLPPSNFPSEFVQTDEMGSIPKGWKVGFMKEIAHFENGRTSPERKSGGIPVFGANGEIGYCTESNKNNVIIIGRVGSYCGSLHYYASNCWVTDNAISASMIVPAHNSYLLELLKRSNLNSLRTGSGQPLLNQSILNFIQIVIPKLPAIEKFSHISSELYYKKFDNLKQIISLSKLRDTLLPKLLSGEIRIKNAEKLIEGGINEY